MPEAAEAKERHLKVATERAVYGTRKHRAEDILPGDVIRNRFGKWDVVTSTKATHSGLYVDINFETGTDMQARRVALIDVQVVKPS